MSLENLYSFIKKGHLPEDGSIYILTGNKHLIEAEMYSGMIAHAKSRTLSHEQIMQALFGGDISRIDESPIRVGTATLEDVQPATIVKMFPVSFPVLLDTDHMLAHRLASFVRLLVPLATRGEEGMAAFTVITAGVREKYPKFSLDYTRIQKRTDDFMSEFHIEYPFSKKESMPTNDQLLPGWVFNAIEMPDGLLKDNFLCYIFLGEFINPMFRVVATMEAGLSATIGFARVSKKVYSSAIHANVMTFFKGTSGIGELNIKWDTEKRAEISLLRADLRKFGLTEGTSATVIFHSKE